MNRFLILTFVCCIPLVDQASGQEGFFRNLGNEIRQQGRELIQQEFGRPLGVPQEGQTPGGQEVPRSYSMPSESGKQSGGGGEFFQPGDQFLLPGNGGGQPFQPNPGLPQGQPFQPDYSTQPRYPNGQQFNPQYGQPYPNYQTYPQQGVSGFEGQPVRTSPKMPSSPVDSRQTIMVRCDQAVTGNLSYTLTSEGRNLAFNITAGQEQHFELGSGWIIGFHDGTQPRRYRLEGGRAYTIKRDANQNWKIYADK